LEFVEPDVDEPESPVVDPESEPDVEDPEDPDDPEEPDDPESDDVPELPESFELEEPEEPESVESLEEESPSVDDFSLLSLVVEFESDSPLPEGALSCVASLSCGV
jgi:hypothetical protein